MVWGGFSGLVLSSGLLWLVLCWVVDWRFAVLGLGLAWLVAWYLRLMWGLHIVVFAFVVLWVSVYGFRSCGCWLV